MGCVLPEPEFLGALRSLTVRHGALLIFDEVMTGFRLALGGAQQLFGIRPDMTTFGKVIGGGLPIGAYGGRADIMSRVAPVGNVYQAGTLSGNPLAVSAGLAMVRHLREHPEIYGQLDRIAARICAAAEGVAGVTVNRCGSMFTIFFHAGPVRSWDDAKMCDTERFKAFHRHLLERGIYFPPSQYEAAFLSAAHDDEAVEATAAAVREFLQRG
jgi:glutamate-1-semialdehyde 2,1-aminomutase